MVHQLLAPADLLLPASPFALLPPAAFGFFLWLICSLAAVVWMARLERKPAPMQPTSPATSNAPLWLASAIYAGLFVNLYALVDEVMINVEHPYNLWHFGKFSMSPESWVDGTVEMLFYLVHTPFAWSHQSLVVANFAITFLVGWLHLPLISRLLGAQASPVSRLLLLCGFALYGPLVTIFSSGFGNGLASLIFLAAVVEAVHGRTSQSLLVSGLLPLVRPDAVLVSLANIAVLAWTRRIERRHLRLIAVPVLSMLAYFALYRWLYGHWVPIPVRFKSLTPAMLAMTDWGRLMARAGFYLLHPAHLAGWASLSFLWFTRRNSIERVEPVRLVAAYALATAPICAFYHFTRATIGDFSYHTYARYWVPFELTLALTTLLVFANTPRWSRFPAWPLRTVLLVILLATALVTGAGSLDKERGREDSVFAGGFTQRYVPQDLRIATTEMNTFGYMLDRPILDLWGYSTPEIATSGTCNADRIRNNPAVFLSRAPDLYWPYWFTRSLDPAHPRGGYDSTETSFAAFHHTSRQGNLLGDMRRVLTEYSVVVVDFPGRKGMDRLAYLVRKPVVAPLLEELARHGIQQSRQRPIDWSVFEAAYSQVPAVTYRCK